MQSRATPVSPQETGAGGCLQQRRGCVAAIDSRLPGGAPVAVSRPSGRLRLNRDLIAGKTRRTSLCGPCPGARGNQSVLAGYRARPSLGSRTHLPSSKVGGTYVADAAAGKAIEAGEPASKGAIEVPRPLRRLQPALDNRHPARKLFVLCGE